MPSRVGFEGALYWPVPKDKKGPEMGLEFGGIPPEAYTDRKQGEFGKNITLKGQKRIVERGRLKRAGSDETRKKAKLHP